jgi:hypothetical protein
MTCVDSQRRTRQDAFVLPSSNDISNQRRNALAAIMSLQPFVPREVVRFIAYNLCPLLAGEYGRDVMIIITIRDNVLLVGDVT